MKCKDCGKNFDAKSSNTKFCPECSKKRQREAVKRCNSKRYRNDLGFRKDMLRRTLEWQSNHPERHWAFTTMKNHKHNGTQIIFSIDKLERMAKETTECSVCGITLDYKKKGVKGFKRNTPSLDNINRKKILSISDVKIICAQCNSAKNVLTMEEFIQYCKIVVKKAMA